MFCFKCGKELPDNAQFCTFCGTRQDINQEKKIVEETLEESVKDDPIVKEFHLFNGTIKIKKSVDHTVEIRRNYNKYAQEASTQIINEYKRLGDMLEVAKNLPNIGLHIIDAYIDKTIQELVGKKIYNVDKEKFKEMYYPVENLWNEASQNAMSEYIGIMQELQQKLENHNQMATGNGNWVGGGFGLEGAIKGAATATALNLATDLVSGAIEAGANKVSENNARKKLDVIYQQENTVQKFEVAMTNVVFEMSNALINAYLDNGETSYCVIGNEEDEANTILNNIRIIEDKEETLVGLLNMYPFATNAIIYAYENDIGNKKEIEEYAEYLELKIIPLKHISAIESMILYANYNDLIEIQSIKEKITSICNQYNIDKDSYLSFLDKVIENLRDKVLVYDDMRYSSIDESVEATRVLNKARKTLLETSASDRGTMIMVKNDIVNSPLLSKDKYLNYLDDKISIANQEAKKVFNIELNTEEEANQNKESLKKYFDILKVSTFNSKVEIENVRTNILNETNEFVSKNYIVYLDKLINIYKKSMEFETVSIPTNRLELSKLIIEMNSVNAVMNEYKLINLNFKHRFDDQLREYNEVFGLKCESIEKAIMKYCDLVSHSLSYKQSLDEKESTAKSGGGFLKSLKAGVSGVLNSRYEDDYNRVTSNGKQSLPDISQSELDELDSMVKDVKLRIQSSINEVKEINIEDPYVVDDSKLTIEELYIENERFNIDAIIEELRGVLRGSILCITVTENSNFNDKGFIVKNFRRINAYYCLGISEDEVVKKLNVIGKQYMVTYLYTNNLLEPVNELNTQGISLQYL